MSNRPNPIARRTDTRPVVQCALSSQTFDSLLTHTGVQMWSILHPPTSAQLHSRFVLPSTIGFGPAWRDDKFELYPHSLGRAVLVQCIGDVTFGELSDGATTSAEDSLFSSVTLPHESKLTRVELEPPSQLFEFFKRRCCLPSDTAGRDIKAFTESFAKSGEVVFVISCRPKSDAQSTGSADEGSQCFVVTSDKVQEVLDALETIAATDPLLQRVNELSIGSDDTDTRPLCNEKRYIDPIIPEIVCVATSDGKKFHDIAMQTAFPDFVHSNTAPKHHLSDEVLTTCTNAFNLVNAPPDERSSSWDKVVCKLLDADIDTKGDIGAVSFGKIEKRVSEGEEYVVYCPPNGQEPVRLSVRV